MTISICIGSSCHLKGSREIIRQLQEMVVAFHLEKKVDLCGSFCTGDCVNGVCVSIDGQIFSVNEGETRDFFEKEVLRRLPC